MKIRLFHVDAFTSRPFAGNPAAVCPLESWLDDATMQSIAAENNLSETAFFVRGRDGVYALRWFTPATEVDLCGHATLASAYVVFRHLDSKASTVTFSSASGPLSVSKDGDDLALDFPARPPSPMPVPDDLAKALGRRPREVWAARDYMALYDTEEEVRAVSPDMESLAAAGRFATIVTAPGDTADFVSRFFAPAQGVPEDPVTGSAHCTLVPYWAKRLGKTRLRALQVSRRGGELDCEDRGERVSIAGRAVQYLEGVIEL
jgi:PhzF family phenazine biosynthesis protein